MPTIFEIDKVLSQKLSIYRALCSYKKIFLFLGVESAIKLLHTSFETACITVALTFLILI